MSIQGSIDWPTIIGACVSILVTLLGLASGPIAEYISDRRNRNSWENILKEIDVFNHWVDEGHMETIDRLYSDIENSINIRFEKRRYPAYWFPMTAIAFFDIWYAIDSFMNKTYLICAISLLSLVCVVTSAICNIRKDAEYEANRKAALRDYVRMNAERMASYIEDAQAEEEKLARLERNDDIDARWVAHLSRGSIYSKRVFSENRYVAREKAEDMELERLVDRVMQLPTEPPDSEE